MRLVRASLVSLLLLCLLTGAVNAQTCPPLQGVQATLEGAQNFCRTSTGGTYTATEYGGGTSTHQWVYGPSSSGPWTPIAGATGTTYQLTGSDFPSTGMFWIAVTSTPQCGSPMTGGAQSVNIYDTLPAPDMYGDEQICAGATSAIAQSAAQWDSYSWSITHGTLIPGANGCGDDPTKRCVSFRPDGTGEVHLSLTVTAGSCSSNALRAVPIVENTPPPLYVSTPVCPGGQGGAYTSQYPAGTRSWSVTNGHIDSDWGDHIFFTADGNGPVDVTLTFTDTNGCSSMSTGRAQLAGTKPVITLGTPACSTNGTASANGGWDAYDWSITNGTITYGQGTANISFSASGGGPMVLTVNGRANFGTFNCSTASDPVTVPSVPTPTITLATADMCPYGSDTATAPEGYANYWWLVNNGYITAGDGTNSIRFSRGGYPNNPNDPITITLFVADANGCSAPQATATVPTRTIPPPTITLDTPDICPYGTNTATVPAQYANYWWSLNNGYLLSGDGTNSIRFSRGGYPFQENEPITITLFVQDANGCPAPQARVTVPTRAIDAPVITLGTPDICPYGTNTATVPAQYANYWWSLNNGYLISGDGTNSIRFSRGGYPFQENEPITITLFVQDANGCPAPQARATVPTRSIPAPVITLGTPDICKYGTNTATVPAQYANYWWSLNNGYLLSGDGTNSITFGAGGGLPGNNDPITITLFVQDANGCPAPQSTVTVPIRNILPPTITLATPDICPYGTNTATVPAQYASYWWSLNNGYLISGDGTNSITFGAGGGLPGSPSDPVTITIFVTDASGCPAPQSSVTVPIRTIPPPTITLATPDVCPYGNDTASVPAQYAMYSWSITGGYLTGGSLNSNSITFSPNPMNGGPVTVSLYVTDGNGCPVHSGDVVVPIRTISPPTITLATPDVCPYGNDTASVPAQYAMYSWSITGGYLTGGSLNSNSITFSPDPMNGGPVTLSLYVTDGNGCPVHSGDVVVPVRTIPPPTITLATPDVCPNGSDTASVPAQYAMYSWSITGGYLTGGSLNSNSVTFSPDPMNGGPVTLSLYVTDGNGCPVNATVVVPIRTIAPPVITASGSTSLCGGGSVTLTAPDGFSYAWSNGATTRAITVTQPGDYFVTVSDPGSCSAVSTPVHVTVATPSAFVITTLHDTTCLYGSIQSTISNPSLFSNITWSVAGGAIFPNGASAWTEADNGTVSQVSITAHAIDVATGCPVSSTVVIPIVPLDPPVMTVSSNGPICYGTPVTISIPPQPAGSEIIWDYQGVKLGGGNGQPFITLSAPPSPSFSLRVRLTDPRFCTTQNTITVPVHLPVVPVLQADDRYGCAYAEKTVTLTNPSAYTSYTWSVTNGTIIGPNNQPTVHIGLMGPGVNTDVTLTASDGTCPIYGSAGFYSTQPTASISLPAGQHCVGYNATLYVTTDGFYHPTYLWSNGATTSSITVTPDAPGPYTVTVTNEYGCSTTSAPVTIPFEPTSTTVTAGGPTTFCAGGSVILSAAMTGQSYLWSNGATTRSISVTQSGSYSVTVNSGQCQYVSPATTVTVNPLPAATITAGGPTTFCAGGSVTLTASAGSTYAWSNGATTQAITVTAGGSYSVTVTNANGCSATSAPTTVAVNALPAVTITAGGPTTFCSGGSVTLTASAGASYLWSTGATTRTIAAGATGNYTVTVTDANGCSATSAPAAVTANPLPATTIAPSGPTTFCTGGSVTLTAPSGVSYLWSTGATTSSIVASTSGDYTVTVTNGNGCTATSAPATVTVNSLPAAAITVGGPTTFCPGGSVTLTASSGASYLWSTGATTSSIAATTSGNYTVTVTNANGCGATSAPIAVTTNPTPAAIISADGPTTFCAGGNVRLTTSGGASYLWSTGATTSSIVASTSGSYTVTVTNGYGCSATSAPLVVTANATPPATITAGGPTTFCAGGSVTLTASSGASYLWSTGATTPSIVANNTGTYVVTVTYANGCSATSTPFPVTANAIPAANITAGGPTTFCAPGSVTLTASSATSYLWSTGETTRSIVTSTSGNYTVTTSANGCSATSATTSVTVNPPAVASITASGPTTFCAGGNVTLTASSGASYLWSTGATTQSIVANTSNNYSVTVTNANGCSAMSAATLVTVNANPAASITVYGSTTFCAGGNVTLAAPSPASSYLWSNGATTQAILATSGGNYTVTVTNASGCSTTSAPVTVTVNPSPVATITASGPTTFCDGGNVTLTSSSAASYLWSTGATTQSIVATYASSYTVTVTDAIGCSATSAPSSVSVIANLPPTISVSGPTTFCAGGGVALSASGGYDSYLWSNGATTPAIIVTSNGSYTVAATRNGCTATSAPVVVTVNANPPAPAISASGPTTFCAGGSVTLTAPAGFTYSWSNGATTQSIVTSTSGNYTVTVTDANGCRATSAATPVTVQALPTPAITAGGPTTFCAGGSVTLTASAGSSYLWSTGATTRAIAASTSGGYSVTVTDANGCSAGSVATTVTVNPGPAATITAGGPTTFCAGGSVTLTASSGSSYLWSNGAATQAITVTASGNYSVTVTNAAGCSTASAPTAVTVRPLPTATVSGTSAICLGGSTTITATLTGTAPWTVTWSDNVTQTINTGTTASRSVSPSATRTYTVTLTDANCSGTSSGSATVTVRPLPTAVVSGTGAICPGGSTTITATLTGTAPWTVTWSDNVTQTINTGTTASRSVSPATTRTYTVTSLTDANCTGTSSGSATITVKTLPTAAVSGGGTICPGGSATITATLTGTAPFTVIWSDNVTQTINSGTTASRTVSPAATTTYTVTSVSDAASCPRAGTGSATVTRNAAASITTQPSNVTTTRNTNITLSVVAAGTAPISYQWFNGNGTTISGATSSSYTTSFTKKGTNTFYVEVWNACNTTHVRSNTVTVTVN